MKKCVWCAEEIQTEAAICRYCGRHVLPLHKRIRQAYVEILAAETLLHAAVYASLGYGAWLFFKHGGTWLGLLAALLLGVGTWFWAVVGPFNDEHFASWRFNLKLRYSATPADLFVIKSLVLARRAAVNDSLVAGLLIAFSLKLPAAAVFPVAWFMYLVRAWIYEHEYSRWAAARNEMEARLNSATDAFA